MNRNEPIDWDLFQSKFYKLEPGKQANVLLTRWRQRETTFREGEEPRVTLCFDVLKADDNEFIPPREWSTTSPSLAEEFKPIIDKAVKADREFILVILKRTAEKRYIVIDISDQAVKKKYQGLKE